MKARNLLFAVALVLCGTLKSQTVNVQVNLNVNHQLGAVTKFERSKFVTLHADVLSSDWDLGTNSIADTRNHFLNGYDVYMGRNTGPINGDLNNAWQDAGRPGFVDPNYYTNRRNFWKNYYGSRTSWHQYDDRNNLIICPQLHPFWPDGTKLSAGWALSTKNTAAEPLGTASGEFLANYVNKVFGTGGTDGQRKPKLVEIVNEPVYDLVDWHGSASLTSIFNFHKTVAQKVKALNPDVKVGGYVTAFPDFDKNNFNQWESRWKSFIDIAVSNVDFYSLHFYDMPVFGGKAIYRKGGDIEATFDMLEHYSYLKFGAPKSFVISEYGATVHDYQGPWSSYRDWLRIKAMNSMMLQFMSRANLIDQTINYTMLKVDWWSPSNNGTANSTWPDRLFRKANEPASYTGNWVYTDMIHYYDLWKNVNGKRVDSWSSDLDVMTDAFVTGNKAYVIINNLDFTSKTIDLTVNEDHGLNVSQLTIKQLYLSENNARKDQNTVKLDKNTYYSNFPSKLTLKPEGTYVLEYTLNGNVNIDETSKEVKYYANKYKQAIYANTANTFAINGVTKGSYGEATLRIGVGRNLGKSLKPTVTVNGTQVSVPDNIKGDAQTDRGRFFGMIEVDVPYNVLKTNNTISVTFPDGGGFISSMALQAYRFSKPISRNGIVVTTPGSISVDNPSKYTSTKYVSGGKLDVVVNYEAGTNKTVSDTYNGIEVLLREMTADWSTVVNDYRGNATSAVGKQNGQVTVSIDLTGVTPSNELPAGNFYFLMPHFKNSAGEELALQGLNPINIVNGTIQVTGVTVNTNASIDAGSTVSLTANVLPNNATNKNVTWSSSNTSVATVNSNGVVSGVSAGTANITVKTQDGNKTDVCVVTVNKVVAGSIAVDDKNKYKTTEYKVGGTLDVTVVYNAGTGNTVANDLGGVRVMLRECTPQWAVVNDYIAADASAIGKQSGTTVLSIDLSNVPPTSDLPDGNFYFLFPRFIASDGSNHWVNGLTPINIVDGKAGIDDIIIEAENFNSTGGTIDESAWGGPGLGVNDAGTNINWVNSGDYTEYTINVAEASEYLITYYISTPSDNAQVQISVDGTVASTDNVTNNGQWDSFYPLTAANSVYLSKGIHTIRIKATGSNTWQWNLDKVILSAEPDTKRGLLKVKDTNVMKVYPNPVKDMLNVELTDSDSPATIKLLSIDGEIIVSEQTYNNYVDLYLGNLPAGTYILQVNDGVNILTEKVIKN